MSDFYTEFSRMKSELKERLDKRVRKHKDEEELSERDEAWNTAVIRCMTQVDEYFSAQESEASAIKQLERKGYEVKPPKDKR